MAAYKFLQNSAMWQYSVYWQLLFCPVEIGWLQIWWSSQKQDLTVTKGLFSSSSVSRGSLFNGCWLEAFLFSTHLKWVMKDGKFVPRSWHADYFIFTFVHRAPNLPFFILSLYSTISTLLILAVCRIRVKYEPSKWPHSPWVLCSSVDRALTQFLGGHRFESCRGLSFFLCPTLMTCQFFHLHICSPSLKFTILHSFTTPKCWQKCQTKRLNAC